MVRSGSVCGKVRSGLVRRGLVRFAVRFGQVWFGRVRCGLATALNSLNKGWAQSLLLQYIISEGDPSMRLDLKFMQHLQSALYAKIVAGVNPETVTISFGHIDGLRIQTKTTPVSTEIDLPDIVQQAASDIRNRLQAHMLRKDWATCTLSFPDVFFSYDAADKQLMIWFEVVLIGKAT